jgi:long-chain acyl-CoA synthetase
VPVTARTPPVADDENLTHMVWANADRFAHAVALRRPDEHSWLDVTTTAFAAAVHARAAGLIAAGAAPGDRVPTGGVVGYERLVLWFAVWAIGGIADPTVAAGQVVEAGRALVRERSLAVRAADPALVGADGVYTHGELLTLARGTLARHAELIRPGNSLLVETIEPWSPVAVGVELAGVYARATVGHLCDPDPLAELGGFRPTAVLAGPAVLGEVHRHLRKLAAGRSRDATAEELAIAYGRTIAAGRPDPALRLRAAIAARLAGNPVRAALGGRCLAVFATSPVPARLADLLRGTGVALHTE